LALQIDSGAVLWRAMMVLTDNSISIRDALLSRQEELVSKEKDHWPGSDHSE